MATAPSGASATQAQPQQPTNIIDTGKLQTQTWTESDFINTLARLERLQSQLDTARQIPSHLIKSLQQPSPDPSSFASGFISVAKGESANLEALKRNWEDRNMWMLLQRCARTTDKYVDLVGRYEVGIWGWEEREAEMKREVDQGENGERVRMDVEDERKAMELHRADFETCGWEDEEKTRIRVVVARVGAPLNVLISRVPSRKGVCYGVECRSILKDGGMIERAVGVKNDMRDIYALLAMLKAYGDESLRQKDCDKCGKYRNSNGVQPYGRRKVRKVKEGSQKGEEEQVWVALHEGCISTIHKQTNIM